MTESRARAALSGTDVEFNKKHFFEWCAARGLHRPDDIRHFFRLSGQTIRNWDKDVKSGDPARLEIAFWVVLAILFYDDAFAKSGEIAPTDLPEMGFADLKEWQSKHRFKTYESTARAFRIKRQAVHLWQKRRKIPAWVALACAGYELWAQSNSK